MNMVIAVSVGSLVTKVMFHINFLADELSYHMNVIVICMR